MELSEIMQRIQIDFGDSMDLVMIPNQVFGRKAVYCFFEELTDKLLFETNVMRPLSAAPYEAVCDIEKIQKSVFVCAPVEMEETIDGAESRIEGNEIALFIEGIDDIFIFAIRKWEKRAVEEPPTSAVLKGPREGFTEDVTINLSLLRRRIKSKKLVIQKKRIGRRTDSLVCVCFISDIADSKIVEEVNRRLGRIDIDGILDSSYIAKIIEDNKNSLFQQIGSSEKPDTVVAKLLEGRIAIIVEGSPMVLTVPYIMIESFQDAQDYYERNIRAVAIRFIRFFGTMLALLLPAGFVAVQEFQHQILPMKLLITIINSTNGIPIASAYEMVLVLLIFDTLNEASIRMPRYVGMALSIVGAIVLGETAVAAGLFSSPAVLVGALSSIGLYTVPNDAGTMGVLRYVFIAAAMLGGMLGIVLSIMLLVSYLVTLRSFGTNYLAPYAPVISADFKDGFGKSEINDMRTRPESIPNTNKYRMADVDEETLSGGKGDDGGNGGGTNGTGGQQ